MDSCQRQSTTSRITKWRFLEERGNGDESCGESRGAFETRGEALEQRFRIVDDSIFNENRWSLAGQKRAGAT